MKQDLRAAPDSPRDEQLMSHVTRLAELGVMSAMLLHELRQPLFALKGYMQMMLHEERQNEKVDPRKARALGLIEDIERMCSAFLDFSRNPDQQMLPVDLRQPVEAALEMLRPRMKRLQIDVHSQLPAQLPLVLANMSTMRQVAVNLLVNAMDALESRGIEPRRHIWINAAVLELDGRPEQIEILIADDGIGVPEELGSRIFERFFTTKPEGKGTGLGLAFASEMIRAHGGTLSLVPPEELTISWQPTPRTVFRVVLPVYVSSR